jgi:hypothetical protein
MRPTVCLPSGRISNADGCSPPRTCSDRSTLTRRGPNVAALPRGRPPPISPCACPNPSVSFSCVQTLALPLSSALHPVCKSLAPNSLTSTSSRLRLTRCARCVIHPRAFWCIQSKRTSPGLCVTLCVNVNLRRKSGQFENYNWLRKASREICSPQIFRKKMRNYRWQCQCGRALAPFEPANSGGQADSICRRRTTTMWSSFHAAY